jgi:hypothetical protein
VGAEIAAIRHCRAHESPNFVNAKRIAVSIDGSDRSRHSPIMLWKNLLLVSCMSVAFTQPVAAQSPSTRYAIPCQTRAAFVSRLRSLVRHPDRVEIALTQFSIIVTRDADSAGFAQVDARAWTLTVNRADIEQSDPRTVHDATCQAVAEASALVVSAWMDESEPLIAAAKPSVVEAPPAVGPQPVTYVVQPPPPNREGFSLRLDGTKTLGTGTTAGGLGNSVEFWNLAQDQTEFSGVGVSYWPKLALLNPTARNLRNQREYWEVFLDLVLLWVDLGDLRFGPYAKLIVAGRSDNKGDGAQVLTARYEAGAQLRWQLGGPWALRYGLGIQVATYHNEPSLVSTLGLDLMVF